MEVWIFYAVVSAIFAGLYSFTLKVIAHYNFDAEKSLFYALAIGSVLSGTWLFYSNPSFYRWDIILLCALVNGVTYYIAIITRIFSLRYIHTTIYFPIYKTIGPIIGTIVGILYFDDIITQYEAVGIALGIVVPLFLISRSEEKIQNNLRKGLGLLMIGAILTIISGAAGKSIHSYGLDVSVYIFLGFIVMTLIGWIQVIRSQRKHRNAKKVKHSVPLSLLLGVFHIFSFYFFVLALNGDFSVAVTINAFSILIPIVLSVWFFKEHMNLRKGFVIALSIVSIIFFTF